MKHIELIEAYYEGRLSPEEKVEFEVRLLVDRELEEEYQLYKKIVYGFDDIKADRIRDNLKKIDRELDQSKNARVSPASQWWFWAIAASILIVALIYYNQSQPARFTAESIPYDAGLPVLMGPQATVSFDNAMSAFKAEDYVSAEKGFELALKEKPANDTTLFYFGNSCLHSSNYSKAIIAFRTMLDQPTSGYYQKSQYYLALSYWANGNLPAAKALFYTLSTTKDHPFAGLSKSQLDKLH